MGDEMIVKCVSNKDGVRTCRAKKGKQFAETKYATGVNNTLVLQEVSGHTQLADELNAWVKNNSHIVVKKAEDKSDFAGFETEEI